MVETDETESPEFPPDTAALAGDYLFGGLAAFAVIVFSWSISADCHFNSIIYHLIAGAAVAWLVCYLALWLSIKLYGPSKSAFLGHPITARTLVLMFYGPFFLFGLLSLLLFFTSRDTAQVTTQIHATGAGRGCRMIYDVYNEPTGRTLHVCSDKFFWNATSGDVVVIDERLGPLGARILSFRRRS